MADADARGFARVAQSDTNTHVIRYESLFVDPLSEIAKVCRRLEVPFENEMIKGPGDPRTVTDREIPWKANALNEPSEASIGRCRTELTARQVNFLQSVGGDVAAAVRLSTYPRYHRAKLDLAMSSGDGSAPPDGCFADCQLPFLAKPGKAFPRSFAVASNFTPETPSPRQLETCESGVRRVTDEVYGNFWPRCLTSVLTGVPIGLLPFRGLSPRLRDRSKQRPNFGTAA